MESTKYLEEVGKIITTSHSSNDKCNVLSLHLNIKTLGIGKELLFLLEVCATPDNSIHIEPQTLLRYPQSYEPPSFNVWVV